MDYFRIGQPQGKMGQCYKQKATDFYYFNKSHSLILCNNTEIFSLSMLLIAYVILYDINEGTQLIEFSLLFCDFLNLSILK